MGKDEVKEFKCPFCGKSFSDRWRVVNHVRQSRTGDHGPMGSLPDGFDPQTLNFDGSTVPGVQDNKTEDPDTKIIDPDLSNVTIINPPVKSKTEILLCPDCNAPKTDWININQVDDASADEKRAYDYMCPECKELIKLHD